jgi:hypothetical protein
LISAKRRVPGSRSDARSESRLPYACIQKMSSISRDAAIRSGIILRSAGVRALRSAARRTVLYAATRAAIESCAGAGAGCGSATGAHAAARRSAVPSIGLRIVI